MTWSNYFSCLGNKSSQGDRKSNKNSKNNSTNKNASKRTNQEISNIKSNNQHRFHDGERSPCSLNNQHASCSENDPKLFCNGDCEDLSNGQNFESSIYAQDYRQALSYDGNYCNSSFGHDCLSANRNNQRVFNDQNCSNAVNNSKRRRSSKKRNYTDLSRDTNYSNLFWNPNRESSLNNRSHRDFSYCHNLTRENRTTKGSNDIRMAHRIRLNEVSSISTPEYDEYFSCAEE